MARAAHGWNKALPTRVISREPAIRDEWQGSSMEARGEVMTESDRVWIVERMFPDWKEHLNDRKTIDRIMKGLRYSPRRTVQLRRCEKNKQLLSRQTPTDPNLLKGFAAQLAK
jgi:hypothetical protein